MLFDALDASIVFYSIYVVVNLMYVSVEEYMCVCQSERQVCAMGVCVCVCV